ncbi:MAG: TIGR00366 family protein [Woeseiaceae bacterium]|nr:TIGR00366 family protein [Woeseiaceae bacterium]
MTKSRWSIDSLVLIFSFIVVAQLLSYVLPQGSFDREPYPDNPAREMVVAGSYTAASEETEVTMMPWHFLLAISEGFAEAQNIIFLVFLVGGVIAVLRRTGAIDAALHGAVEKLGHSPWILISGCLFIFSFGAFTIGMGEEYVPLVPIIVSMSLAMRMDAIVAMGMVWVPYGIGWACAGTNPFGVLIAQNIAGVPLTSGMGYRLVIMAVFLVIAFHHLYRYAMRVQRDPSTSLVAHVDYSNGFEAPEDISLTPRRVAVLVVFLIGLIGFVYGVKAFGWYIAELNAVFLGIGIVSAIVARLPAGETSRTFIQGAAEMTAAALLIGFARTIEVVLSDGQIIDTIIHAIASVLENTGPEVASLGMLLVQTICNLFIPSGSGQAYVTMPIMSPLATLTDVPQQTAVLAYQFGDGLTNMIVPTSALVMGALALGRIPYGAWVRFVGPLLLKLFAAGAVFLVASIHLAETIGFTT